SQLSDNLSDHPRRLLQSVFPSPPQISSSGLRLLV
ncbi:hypothetical protein TNCV_3066751, partial [Trichonephila clavipes]